MMTLTLQDTALLAGVTRQAVTNWRTRRSVRGVDLPFPEPVAIRGGVERFERDAVLAWLEATGRGRNPDAREDVPGIAVPEGVDLATAVVMLGLRTLSGMELGEFNESELEALAHQVDPDDQFLLAEVRDIGNRPQAATYADELFNASFGPSDALDRLYQSRLARAVGDRGFTDELLDLLAGFAGIARSYLGADDVAIDLRLDPRGRRIAEGFAGLRVGEQADPVGSMGRDMLRHLRIAGMHPLPGGPLVRVLSAVGLGDAEALDFVDSAALDLSPHQITIVVGSGSALCDRSQGALATQRSQTIEMRSLVAAFRLPRGMWRTAHRQHLGLWVLRGGEPKARAIVASDLSGRGPIAVDDLCSDVYAALEQTKTRGYRYGRPVPHLQALGRGPVVPVGLRELSASSTQNHLDGVNSATLVTREAISGFNVVATSRPAAPIRQPASLGQMKESKQIKVINGSRINPAHLEPTGTTRVLSADPGNRGSMIDPLVAAHHYDHAARTEPGDVIFTDRPRPYAVVDEFGGSIVMSPSRVLRLQSRRGIGPWALARVISLLPADAGDWGTWSIPLLPSEQISVVEQTIEDALDHINELARHGQAMDDLITHLIQGVAAGGLAITRATEDERAS